MTTFEMEENGKSERYRLLHALEGCRKLYQSLLILRVSKSLSYLRLMLSFVFVLFKANYIRKGYNTFHMVCLFRVFIAILKFRY